MGEKEGAQTKLELQTKLQHVSIVSQRVFADCRTAALSVVTWSHNMLTRSTVFRTTRPPWSHSLPNP